jgi:hypothetical protein
MVAGWRDFRPVDLTSAERKRRYRRRLYGERYRGTEGDVVDVQLPTDEEEAERLTAIEILERLECEAREDAGDDGPAACNGWAGAEIERSPVPVAYPRRRGGRRCGSGCVDDCAGG